MQTSKHADGRTLSFHKYVYNTFPQLGINLYFFATCKTAAHIFVYSCVGYTIVTRRFLGRLILSH